MTSIYSINSEAKAIYKTTNVPRKNIFKIPKILENSEFKKCFLETDNG